MSPNAFELCVQKVRAGGYVELNDLECSETELEELAELRKKSGATIHVVLNDRSSLVGKLQSLGAYITPDKTEAVLT